MRKKRLFVGIIIFAGLLIVSGVFSFVLLGKNGTKSKKKMEKKVDISSYYAPYVEVNKDCSLYQKQKKHYQKVGKVGAGEILTLTENQDFSDSYFLIAEKNLYIPYSCVTKSENAKLVDHRYRNYVPFPEKVKTKEKVTLYQGEKAVYELFYPLEFEVFKKTEERYFISYWNELFEVKKEDIDSIYEGEEKSYAKEVPVTAYHFIYKEDDYGCSGIICHPVSQIRSHFEYLKNNQFFTITTHEMEEFLDGVIHLPEKSILITVDDGDRAENIIPLLEEYQLNATLFLITAWYFPENYQSPYLELASHTHELHEPGKCLGGQGSALKCLEKSKIVEDLKTSRATLNGTHAFCYPLYEYNQHALDAVEEAGFTLGFIGGQRRATLSSPKLLIPRTTIFRDTTLQEYIKIVS